VFLELACHTHISRHSSLLYILLKLLQLFELVFSCLDLAGGSLSRAQSSIVEVKFALIVTSLVVLSDQSVHQSETVLHCVKILFCGFYHLAWVVERV